MRSTALELRWLGLFPTRTRRTGPSPLVHKTDFPPTPPRGRRPGSPWRGLQHPWAWPSLLAPALALRHPARPRVGLTPVVLVPVRRAFVS